MLKTYVDHTHDINFAIAAVDILAREFEFWMVNHTLMINGHRVARYGDKSSGPRPESYREDVETGRDFPNETERESHYSELKAAAESGLDFSSRWFINQDGGNTGDLRDLKTRSIIPVELNAILYWNAIIISEFYGYAGNSEKQQEYLRTAQEFMNVSYKLLHQKFFYTLVFAFRLLTRCCGMKKLVLGWTMTSSIISQGITLSRQICRLFG